MNLRQHVGMASLKLSFRLYAMVFRLFPVRIRFVYMAVLYLPNKIFRFHLNRVDKSLKNLEFSAVIFMVIYILDWDYMIIAEIDLDNIECIIDCVSKYMERSCSFNSFYMAYYDFCIYFRDYIVRKVQE